MTNSYASVVFSCIVSSTLLVIIFLKATVTDLICSSDGIHERKPRCEFMELTVSSIFHLTICSLSKRQRLVRLVYRFDKPSLYILTLFSTIRICSLVLTPCPSPMACPAHTKYTNKQTNRKTNGENKPNQSCRELVA